MRLHIHDLYSQNQRLPLLQGMVAYGRERVLGREGGVALALRQVSNLDHRKSLTRFLCSARCLAVTRRGAGRTSRDTCVAAASDAAILSEQHAWW